MKTPLLFALFFLLILSLTACQQAPAPTAAPEQQIPTQSIQETYPPPEAMPTQPVPGSGGVLYPNLQDGDLANWDQAMAMILNLEVKQVTQTHDQQVTLLLKDGRMLITREPSIDEVFKVIEQCGDPCKEIVVATE